MTRRPPIATRTDTLFPDPTLFRSLQDHVVLIGFSLEFVDLPLAEGVVQGLVDIAGGEAKARRRAAVDVDVGDTAAQLQIVGDVPERGVAAQTVGEFLCQGVERRAAVALEYVLILGADRTGNEVDVLP